VAHVTEPVAIASTGERLLKRGTAALVLIDASLLRAAKSSEFGRRSQPRDANSLAPTRACLDRRQLCASRGVKMTQRARTKRSREPLRIGPEREELSKHPPRRIRREHAHDGNSTSASCLDLSAQKSSQKSTRPRGAKDVVTFPGAIGRNNACVRADSLAGALGGRKRCLRVGECIVADGRLPCQLQPLRG